MKPTTMTKMLSMTGITSKGMYLEWEELLKIVPPRAANNHRQFPEELVANLGALRELLTDLEFSLGELLLWKEKLRLVWAKDKWGAPEFTDTYWRNYLLRLQADMKEAGVDIYELTRWPHELGLSYPTDKRDNFSLNRDWIRYLQTVQERYAQGATVSQVRYGIQKPDEVRPQAAWDGNQMSELVYR